MKKRSVPVVIWLLGTLCFESHSSVSPYTSRLVLRDSRQNANGQAQVAVIVELRDELGDPQPGKSVALQSSNSSFVFVQPPATDLNGSATGFLTSLSPSSGDVWGWTENIKILPNLLENSSAETGVLSPTGWTRFSNQHIDSAAQQFLWEPVTGLHTGKALGMRCSENSPTSYELSWFQRVRERDLAPGNVFNVRALVQTGTDYYPAGPAAGLFLNVINENSQNEPITSSRFIATGFSSASAWSEIIVSSIIFPAGASQVQLSLDFVRSTGAAFFDNVRMSLTPPVTFRADHSSPSRIATSSPTLLQATPGANNGEIILSWKSVGNDGYFWPNPDGLYEVRFTKDYATLAVSSWTLVRPSFAPSSPGTPESFLISGLTPAATYQVAIRAVDQSGNKPEFGFSVPVIARSGIYVLSPFTVEQNGLNKPFSSNPAFSGSSPPSARIRIKINGDIQGETISDFYGKWKYDLVQPLTEGTHMASFQAFDSLGNTSSVIEFTFQIGPAGTADELIQIFPNPLRLSKGDLNRLQFSLISNGPASIRIFDLGGREIAEVAQGNFGLGSHTVTWDGKDKFGRLIGTGSYLALFETERSKQTRLLTVIR